MPTVHELMETRRWCYWLVQTEPDASGKYFRVAIVVEDESGHFPTGGGDVEPWYWDEATCREKNRRLGLEPKDADRIVCSSMWPVEAV